MTVEVEHSETVGESRDVREGVIVAVTLRDVIDEAEETTVTREVAVGARFVAV